jgi:HAD superfamily hydrolase (TIGR01450 family)
MRQYALHHTRFFAKISKGVRILRRRGKLLVQGKLQGKKLFLLDMDGTIYLDEQLFDGTLDFLWQVRRTGGRYLFLTNNSSKSVDSYVEKMERLGISAVPQDFLTSLDAAILYLREHFAGKTIYGFGTQTFREQLRQSGFRVVDSLREGADKIDVLLCGFDTELTFQKLEDACILLNRGVEFVATNPDWVCPTWYGYVPDCGSVCEMLYRATGRRPVVIGKPQPEMALLAMKKFSVAKSDTVLLGDRLYTDIACGANAGIDTVFVLSGEGTRADLKTSPVQPTWVLPNIRTVLNQMRAEEKPDARI